MRNKIISDIGKGFIKINNKLNKLEKRAVDSGGGEKFYASELHAIDAIGRKEGGTVTKLCDLFGVTKGAVSQIISKLEKKAVVFKQRSPDNCKEVNIFLTEKGLEIFKFHENLHKEMDKEFFGYMRSVSKEKLEDFLTMLVRVENYLDVFLSK